jgi:energy-coupling factor transporter ATP-binding protein EcfA2
MNVYFVFSKRIAGNEDQLLRLIEESKTFPPVSRNSIILVRDHESQFSVYFYSKSALIKRINQKLQIMFSAEIDSILNQLNSEVKKFLTSRDVGTFISFLENGEYIELYNDLKGQTWSFLIAVRDYHYLKRFKAEKNFLKEFERDGIFNNLKRSRSFRYLEKRGFTEFIYKFQFGRNYTKAEVLDFSMRLKGAETPVSVNIDFKTRGLVPSRISAIIGRNGMGKSRCLAELKNNLVKSEQYRKIISINLFRSMNRAQSPEYVSLSVDSKISYVAAFQNLWDASKDIYFYNATAIVEKLLKKYLNVHSLKASTLAGEVVDLLKPNSPQDLDLSTEPRFFNRQGREFFLSQGQHHLLRLILLLILHIDKNSLVLIDEPEVFLHPNYIVELVQALQQLLKDTDSYAVIATHSIFLIRELPKTSVSMMVGREFNVRMARPENETLGASLDRLAYEIFYDEEVEKRYEAFVQQAQHKKMTIKEIAKLPADLAARVLSK